MYDSPVFLQEGTDCPHFSRLDARAIIKTGQAMTEMLLRLRLDYLWFPDEQPSEEIREFCMSELEKYGWREDVILSHTCPYDLRPLDKLMPGLDESKVDSSTELFLQKIRERITYNKWYCRHWHIDRDTPDIEFLYRKVTMMQRNKEEGMKTGEVQ